MDADKQVMANIEREIQRALIRSETLTTLRVLNETLATWVPPDHWFKPDVSDLIDVCGDGSPPVALVLLSRIGLDSLHALTASLDTTEDQLSPEEVREIEQLREDYAARPESERRTLILDTLSEYPDAFIDMIHRAELPEAMVDALDHLTALDDAFYAPSSDGSLAQYCRHPLWSYGAFEQFSEGESNLIGCASEDQRRHQGFLIRLPAGAGSSNQPVYLWTLMSPHEPEDEYDVIQHTDVTVQAFTRNGPVLDLHLMIETALMTFPNGQYYNCKDSMEGESAAFAHMVIETVETLAEECSSDMAVCDLFHHNGAHNGGMLHFLGVDVHDDQAEDLAGLGALMLQKAERIVTTPNKQSVAGLAPYDTPLIDLLDIIDTGNAHKQPSAQMSTRLCDAITLTWVHPPTRDLPDYYAAINATQDDDEPGNAERRATLHTLIQKAKQDSLLVDSIVSKHQEACREPGSIRYVISEPGDFAEEMLRLAHHNARI